MSAKKPFKKLIWAYDPMEGTNETHAAVARALAYINENTEASIQPVYVLSPADLNLQMDLTQPHLKQFLPSAEEIIQNSLRGIQLEYLIEPEIIVQKTPLLRQAVNSLLSYAKTKHADLIVAGTHARKGLERLLLGSFTETLILHSKIPVLVVNPSIEPHPVRQILFPTDLASGSQAHFKKVCSLARNLGAEVTLLHVISHPIEPVFQTGIYLIGGGWVAVPDFMKATEARQRKIAERWKADAASAGVVVSVAFDPGHEGVRQTILNRAAQMNAGLIAMAAQSGPVATAILGSVARQVVREARCPVWVMRRT